MLHVTLVMMRCDNDLGRRSYWQYAVQFSAPLQCVSDTAFSFVPKDAQTHYVYLDICRTVIRVADMIGYVRQN